MMHPYNAHKPNNTAKIVHTVAPADPPVQKLRKRSDTAAVLKINIAIPLTVVTIAQQNA